MRTSPLDSDTLDFEQLKQEFNRFRDELGGRLGQNASDALAQMSAYLERRQSLFADRHIGSGIRTSGRAAERHRQGCRG